MKKIVFGSIFSVFLLVSITWLSPVSAGSIESERDDLKEMLLDFVNTITNDEEYLDMLNDDDIKKILNDILYAETEDDTDQYKQELDNLIQTRYLSLINRYVPVFESLKDKVENLDINPDIVKDEINQGNYYKLDVEDEKFSITKQKGDSISGSAILINGKNASIKVPGYGWINESFWDNILDFLEDLLSTVTTVFEAVVLFITVIAYVFLILTVLTGGKIEIFYLLAEHTMNIMLYVMGLWFKTTFVLTALIIIIEFIADLAKTKFITKSSSLLEKLVLIFKQLQTRIDLIFARYAYA